MVQIENICASCLNKNRMFFISNIVPIVKISAKLFCKTALQKYMVKTHGKIARRNGKYKLVVIVGSCQHNCMSADLVE